MGKLERKVAIITGASKGIGEGIARTFARYGAKLVLAARGEKVLQLAEELGQRGVALRAGLHCAPLAHRTLETYPQGTVRFAFSGANTREEIDCCMAGIRELFSV